MKELFIFNTFGKKLANKILSTSWIINNNIYQYLYQLRMNKIMNECENKPQRVYLETTNYCHDSCPFCPHRTMKREKGIMSWDIFKSCAKQIADWEVNEVVIGQFGEPLLDLRFFEQVKYCKELGINKVQTNVSSQAITKRIANYLCSCQLDELFISCSKQGEDNMKYFLSKKRNNKMKVYLSFIDKYTTPVYKWVKNVDGVSVSYPNNWAGFLQQNNDIPRDPCRLLWVSMYVNWEGKVHMCCMDYECEEITGDVSTSSLQEIWVKNNFPLRLLHKTKQWDKIKLCQKCDYNAHNKSPWWV